MARTTPITVAYGDGIGPEIMEATLGILDVAGARLEIEKIEVGQKIFEKGYSSGIEDSSWESLRRTKVFLKAPITTPQGGGYKSLNVTIRTALGLYANVRPCVAYPPFVKTHHPRMDLVIVRENEEDLYTGIEHRQSFEVYQTLKLVSLPGSERIIRYAFEYARLNGRKKVTCFSKDNIMKFTDGLFHRTFDRIAKEYPELESEHWIVDIGAALVADNPTQFDVIVMPNLYGDIISDIAAQVSGSVGLGGSANIGNSCAMFEAIHGSAPRIAGQNIANPSGLLLSSVMMLVHIGQGDIAERIHNAWLYTIESGVHTPDIFTEGVSTRKVGTAEFATEVIENLGKSPLKRAPVRYPAEARGVSITPYKRQDPLPAKTIVGVDVFIDALDADASRLGAALSAIALPEFSLKMITNRGVKVWPNGFPETFCTDHWRCRFMATERTIGHEEIISLLGRIVAKGLDFIKIENLCAFDGEAGFSLGQGE